MREVKRNVLLIFLSALSVSCLSQNEDFATDSMRNVMEDLKVESSQYYHFPEPFLRSVNVDSLRMKLDAIRRLNDSLYILVLKKNLEKNSDSLVQLYDKIHRGSNKDYGSWYFTFGKSFNRLEALQNSLNKAGIPALNPVNYEFSYLLSFNWKRGRKINDICILTFSTGRNTSGNGISVNYNYIRPISYYFGYSIVDLRLLDIYPFAGPSWQISQITTRYTQGSKHVSGISNYDSLISSISKLEDTKSYSLSRGQLMLDYGVEADLHAIYSRRRGGMIIGFRWTGTLPIIKNQWNISGTKYSEFDQVKLKDYSYNLVLKFYWRKSESQYSISDFRFY